jgi:phenylacetate-CoA ligase
MLIKIELLGEGTPDSDKKLAEAVTAAIRKLILVRVQVEVLPYGTLTRTEGKSRRVFDHRSVEGV